MLKNINTQFLCPYCNNSYNNNKRLFTSWKGVSSHARDCISNKDNSYVFDSTQGSIHVSVFQKGYSSNYIRYLYPNLTRTLTHIKSKFTERGFIVDANTSVNWSDVELLCILHTYYKLFSKIPIGSDFDELLGYPKDTTYSKYFGSWNNALEEAGFITPHLRDWSQAKIIQAIQSFVSRNGRIPQAIEFKSNPSKSTVTEYFETWNDAIAAAGFIPNYNNGFGTRTLGNDNILYMSGAEAYFVNNYLYNRYIYEYEKPYGNGWFYDFYLPEKDLFIELTGGLFPSRIEEKVLFNKLHNRNCLIISTMDIYKKGFKFL
jgi:hypothetical protein